jgi:hypothetical protein
MEGLSAEGQGPISVCRPIEEEEEEEEEEEGVITKSLSIEGY